MSRPRNTPAGRQIALPRPVAALAHQLARAEERAVQVVIERALKAYALASPEWQALNRPARQQWPVNKFPTQFEPLPPQRDGEQQQSHGHNHDAEHDQRAHGKA